MADSNESVLAWAASALANQAKNVGRAFKNDMARGTGPAIGREAINDIRGSLHQVFFSQAEANGEPGAPMSPLQSDVAELRKSPDAVAKGTDAKALYGRGSKVRSAGAGHAKPGRLPSPAEIAKETKPYQPGKPPGNGQEHGNSR